MERPIDAVMFDWDGTLQDSMPEQYKGFKAVFAAEGLNPPSLEFFCRNLSVPILPWYRSLGISRLDEPRIVEIFRSVTDKSACPLFPEVEELLSDLGTHGIKTGVVSAGRIKPIEQVIRRCGLDHAFRCLICDAWDKVPALKEACDRLDVSPDRCVYVGDIASDVRDGHAAGLKSIAFLGSYGSETSFYGLNPYGYARSFADLRRILLPS